MSQSLGIRSSEDDNAVLKSIGGDISSYRDQLMRERNARTLNLRRSNRPTIAKFLSKNSSKSPNSPLLVDTSNFPFLDPAYAISQLRTSNPIKLREMLNSLLLCMHQTPRLANNLLKNPELPEAFIDALNSGFPEDLNILIMKTIIVIFPHSPEVQDIYIDSGLYMCLFDFLSSQSLPLLEASIALVDTISESSGYGRDSVLCLGLHTFNIEIAKSEINEQITVQACESLSKIFSNKQHIDSNTLTSCVEPIAELLSLHSVHAVYIILACFISMTNKLPALVFNMYDLNLFPVIVNFLHNPELIGMALPLIGNLSVGQSFHIKTLLDCGLFPLLMQLIQTEFTADVYWVLSNILESVPQMTIGLFNPNFVAQTVEIAMTSSFEVKKEAAFFIATLMLFTQNADLKYFKNEDVVDLMIEMLGCSSNLIVLRCLDALLRFVHVNSTTGDEEFLSLLQTKDLYNPLNNLIERGSHMIKERAEFLLCNLDATKSVI